MTTPAVVSSGLAAGDPPFERTALPIGRYRVLYDIDVYIGTVVVIHAES